jgi:hypothetical protein
LLNVRVTQQETIPGSNWPTSQVDETDPMVAAAAKPAAFAITEEVKKKVHEAALTIRREALQRNEGRN